MAAPALVRTWDIDTTGQPAPAQYSAYHGESVEFVARLLGANRRPVALDEGWTAALMVSTNGVDYWRWDGASVSTGGVIRATWEPRMDCGADTYRCFIRAADPSDSNLIYRAAFALRLLDSPGFRPNELEPPVRTLDFATVDIANAPWIEEESDPVWSAEKDGYARTGDVARAIAEIDIPSTNGFLRAESDPVWETEKCGYATTNDLAGKLSLSGGTMSGPLDFGQWPPMVSSLENEYFGLKGKTVYGSSGITVFNNLGFSTKYTFPSQGGKIASSNDVAIGVIRAKSYAHDVSAQFFEASTNHADEAVAGLRGDVEAGWFSEWVCEPATFTPEEDPSVTFTFSVGWDDAREDAHDPTAVGWALKANGVICDAWYGDENSTRLEMQPDSGDISGYDDRPAVVVCTRHRVAGPVPTRPEDIGAQPAGDYATAGEITEASNNLARAWSADSVLLSSMLLGSNVVAEVANYNSQVRSPTLRLLQLNESNEYFQVWAETNNLSRVALAATNYADTVSAAAYNAATNYAAPRAWGGTTSGLGADAPEGWTWISTPQMAIAGGLEYEKNVTTGGAIWILKSNGMAAGFHSVSNNTAYLDISATDGSSLFRIEKTDSFLVGVDTTSVNVSGDALVCGVNCVSATHPLVRVRQSLTQGQWAREEDGIPADLATVEWSGESGAWVCEITNTSGGHSMFATMEMLQEGGAKLVNAAALDVSASGILCTDGVHKVRPVYNNGSVTWEVFQ